MRSTLARLTVLAVALVAAPASIAPLQAQSAPIQGTFVYVAQGSDDINAAIDNAVRRMNFVTRPIARGRLRKTNEVYNVIRFNNSATQVSVTIDQRAAIVSPASGAAVKWTREDGEVLDLATRWTNGALEQSFTAEDGKRVNTYTLSPDGNGLSMQVTITSPRLAAPLRYTLRSRRQ